jgi:hypothetical protein
MNYLLLFLLMGIGDWGLGIGPNPQSPIPNPQILIFLIFHVIKKIDIKNSFEEPKWVPKKIKCSNFYSYMDFIGILLISTFVKCNLI